MARRRILAAEPVEPAEDQLRKLQISAEHAEELQDLADHLRHKTVYLVPALKHIIDIYPFKFRLAAEIIDTRCSLDKTSAEVLPQMVVTDKSMVANNYALGVLGEPRHCALISTIRDRDQGWSDVEDIRIRATEDTWRLSYKMDALKAQVTAFIYDMMNGDIHDYEHCGGKLRKIVADLPKLASKYGEVLNTLWEVDGDTLNEGGIEEVIDGDIMRRVAKVTHWVY